jgi:long-chain fatty acid transport protein
MSFNKSKLALAVAATAGLTFSSGAFATNGIIQAGNGMVAHGFGGAGLSNAGEAAAGMDNPALISQTGDAVSVAWSIFMPDRTVDTSGVAGFPPGYTGETVSDSKMFAIPQVAFTSKINDSMSWGIMAYALGGMNTDYRTGIMGNPLTATPLASTSAESVNLQGMIVAPTMSFAFNKNVSIGGSLIIGYETLTTRNLFAQGAAGTNEGSAMGYGVKLGLDAKVTDGISIGAMIQPKLSMDEISYFKTFLGGFGFSGDAALTLPNEYGIGAKFAAGKSVDIVADILYYQWTSVDVFEFFGWEDQVVYKVGAEFRPTDSLALRVGFNYGESPIQGGNRTGNGSQDAAFANYPFPAISETHFTLGLGYKMDKNMTINAYYLYSPETTQTATGASVTCPTPATCTVPAGTEISMSQNAFGLGINYAAK